MTQRPVGPEVGRERLTHRRQDPLRMRRTVGILLALAARLPRGDADLGEERAADNEFDRLTAEVVRLSRQNTNVKSLARSLGTKRRLAAQCDQTLASLQEEVRRTEFQGTR